MSVVGYGNPLWSQLTAPSVTTVDLPVPEISCSAASMLFRQMRKNGDEREDGRYVEASFFADIAHQGEHRAASAAGTTAVTSSTG
ncbi:substrate-binding domain-containing protein, partial [Bradyrhizobium cosmicum]|uniref:substrate-binding domain-containing protein n=1 Tax=Bradyrhizobium cosmicum TaxID=1404864 RepID=UPI0039655F5D